MIKPYHIYLKHICFSKDHPLVARNEDCAISSKLSSLFLSNFVTIPNFPRVVKSTISHKLLTLFYSMGGHVYTYPLYWPTNQRFNSQIVFRTIQKQTLLNFAKLRILMLLRDMLGHQIKQYIPALAEGSLVEAFSTEVRKEQKRRNNSNLLLALQLV